MKLPTLEPTTRVQSVLACAVGVLLMLGTAAAQTDLPELKCPAGDSAGLVYEENAVPALPSAGSPVMLRLASGLRVTLYTADYLLSRLEWKGAEPIIPLDDGRYLSVITDINDPAIYNKGDGSFHPFPSATVVEILGQISHPDMAMDVHVYILPYPRRNVLASSTSANAVFLSPHVLEIDPLVCSYIVAHEMGHVFQHAYLPAGTPGWDQYLRIRRITDTSRFSDSSPHAYRPVEIFAEDFRVLFGGPDAAFGGRIENPELPSPVTVAGLERFLASAGGAPVVAAATKVRASSFPNPFNPATEIRIIVPREIVASRERVSVRIYDVRGALVAEVYSDVPAGENLLVRWDGHDRRGNQVASANYFALIEAGGARTTLKLVMLK